MGKKVNIRPTTGVYATYKNIKYDPWTAIAEFVDNSTQSYYDNKERLKKTKYWDGLNVEILYEKDEDIGDSLVIRDNANGMNFYDFQRAIVLDSPPKKKTRSEFGMGLKTAACWFGVRWSVESTELGSDVKYLAHIDVDALHKYKNEEIEVEEIPCSPKEHGTTITITHLNRQIIGRQIKKTKDQLRGIYRVDLRTGDIKIQYNGEELIYDDPEPLVEELPDGNKNIWKKKLEFIVPHGEENLTVSGYVSILEKANTSGAGFALIRRGRVIVGGYENAYRPEEIFGKSNSFAYQRIYGELNLDEWPVTQTKDDFDWYGGDLEDALINELKKHCDDYVKYANTYRKNKKVDTHKTTEETMSTFSKAGIINNVEIKNLEENEDTDKEELEKTIDVPEKVESKEAKELPNDLNKDDGIELEGPTGKKISFSTDKGNFIFNLLLKKGDPGLNWLIITPHSSDKNEYDIEWNIRHPFFKPYIDEPEFLSIMEKFIFALALAEIESMSTATAGMVSSSSIRMKMNDLLKEVTSGGVSINE